MFRRAGNDLHHDMHITLREALVGFRKTIVHLDGHEVEVKARGVTKPFLIRTISDEGMPHHNFPSTKGNLYVKFHIDFPRRLSDEQKRRLAESF